MDALDWILGPLYVALLYGLAVQTVKKNQHQPLYARYYLRGLQLKFIGAFGFAFIYLFYYGGGDSVNFFYTIKPVYSLFFSDPASFLDFILSPNKLYPWECFTYANSHDVLYLTRGIASLTTIRIGALVDLLCFNSYFAICALFAYWSYKFQWKMFLLLTSIYPGLQKQLAYALLLIPSVVFWGSALSKDTIMLACIMQLFYSFYHVFILKKNMLRNSLVLLVTMFIISLIRGFMLFTMLPCLILMAVTYYRTAIRSSALRFLVGPLFLLLGIGASIYIVRSMGEAVESYNLDSLQQKAEGFRSWHTSQGGATYAIAEDMDYSVTGILKAAPVAIIYCLFGPFVWQIRSPVMLMSGLESLIFLYLFVTRILVGGNLFRLLKTVIQDHVVMFCMPFVLILSTAIGLTSFNFGALVRYRISILPFFALIIVLLGYYQAAPKLLAAKARKSLA